ncbi:MAG TPA: ScyD/ScyE family protein [Sphingomicrobium sp.]|nr:ScyD/ScyE family protein [Sphingomicrobium sp.]
MTHILNTVRRAWLVGSSVAALALALPAPVATAAPLVIRGTPTPSVSVYASGFNNPRGLKFGPDGMLYVAEAGPGGSTSTVGRCEQVPSPVGPYTGSLRGGRISRVDSNGHRTTVTDRFPTSHANPAIGGDPEGVADIDWIGGTMYVLTAGAGCSHGVPNTVNGVYRLSANGNPVLVANLSAFQQAHPTAHSNAGDFEPDGTWYSMVAVGRLLYAVEPNHGEIDQVRLDGTITRVVDISASQGHSVPTAVAYHNGVFYVGNLGTFPIVPGSSKILAVTRNGVVTTARTGLTTVLGVAFDSLGRMYVLENTATAGFPSPNAGDIVRISGAKREVIASGLNLPTAMTFGPDGALYVSILGFGAPPSLPEGPGQVVRIRLGS